MLHQCYILGLINAIELIKPILKKLYYLSGLKTYEKSSCETNEKLAVLKEDILIKWFLQKSSFLEKVGVLKKYKFREILLKK